MEQIKKAISQATGFYFWQYSESKQGEASRVEDYVYLRMIFVHHCNEIGLGHKEITELINRKRCDIIHLLKRYKDLIMTCGKFRVMAYHTNWYLDRLREMPQEAKQSPQAIVLPFIERKYDRIY